MAVTHMPAKTPPCPCDIFFNKAMKMKGARYDGGWARSGINNFYNKL